MRHLMPIALLASLAACNAERSPARAIEAPPADSIQASPSITELPISAPAAQGAVPTPDGDLGMATFEGYGDVRFGTRAEDIGKAWGGALAVVGKEENERCYFMTPAWVRTPSEFTFMVSEGKFARFGTDSAKFVAPGGGKVGMREADLQVLYNQALQASPHKYTDGKYLSLPASGAAPSKLVFETDGEGVVTEWRVGRIPEVDYVEGCA